VQALLEILRRKDGAPLTPSPSPSLAPRSATTTPTVDAPSSAAVRRAGALFALAAIKRSMGSGVLVAWFWSDVQRALVRSWNGSNRS
jgi:hypothetical protein